MNRTEPKSSSTLPIFGTAMLAEFGVLSVESASYLATGTFPTYSVENLVNVLTRTPQQVAVSSTQGLFQGFMDLPLTSAIVVVAVAASLTSKLR